MDIKQLYNDNLRKLPNEHGDVSVMDIQLIAITFKIKMAAPRGRVIKDASFGALNRSSSYRCGFELSWGHMRDKPSSACGWLGVLTRLKMSEIILTDR